MPLNNMAAPSVDFDVNSTTNSSRVVNRVDLRSCSYPAAGNTVTGVSVAVDIVAVDNAVVLVYCNNVARRAAN